MSPSPPPVDPAKLRTADEATLRAARDPRDPVWRMPRAGQLLALGGRLGWMVALPLVVAAWAGHALDKMFGTGIQIAGAAIVLAAAVGMYALWRSISR
jgi:ATP synthase protein I